MASAGISVFKHVCLHSVISVYGTQK